MMGEYIEREPKCDDCLHNGVCYMQEVCNDIEKQLKEFGCNDFKPAADVVEVRHGEWEILLDLQERNVILRCVVENQKEEVERLQNKLDTVKKDLVETIPLIKGDIETTKAETIKRFEDKIKDKFDKHGVEYTAYVIVDDVSKEMVGQGNNSPIVDNQK